jgi:ParB-like nuclease domain
MALPRAKAQRNWPLPKGLANGVKASYIPSHHNLRSDGHMQVPIGKVKPNRFRRFDLYPINELQVQRIQQSMEDLGIFQSLPARKLPDGNYELAAGHHRLESAKRLDIASLDLTVCDYSDLEMVEVMTAENLTQRGYSAAAALDSVAAYALVVAREVLLGDATSKIFEVVGTAPQQLAPLQAKVAKDGPGEDLIYRTMNGFDRDQARAKKAADSNAERISLGEVRDAISSLKQSGEMASIVEEALRQVQAIRAERRAAEEAAAAAAAQEAARREAEEAERQRKAQEREEQLKREAEAAERAKAADAARKREAAEEAKRESERLAKEAAEREAKRKAEAAAKAEAEAKQQAKEAAELASVRNQLERAKDPAYDIRCVDVFRVSSHEATFRRAVLSENGRRFVPVSEQFELAQAIRRDIDAIETKRNMKVGSITVYENVMEHIDERIAAERARLESLKGEEQRAREMEQIEFQRMEEAILNDWRKVTRHAASLQSILSKMRDRHYDWTRKYPSTNFPLDQNALRTGREASDLYQQLAQAILDRVNGKTKPPQKEAA